MNLKRIYPQPRRVVLRDSFWWLASGVILTFLILGLADGARFLSMLDVELLILKKSALLTGVIAVVIVRVTYGFMYRATYQCRIERGRLQIIRGVILKEEALLPLLPLTELYIKRSWLDLLFGLSSVYVAVILERAQKVGEIQGLKHRDALKVRDEILRVIEAQQLLPGTPSVTSLGSPITASKRMQYRLDNDSQEAQMEVVSALETKTSSRGGEVNPHTKRLWRLDCIDVS